MGVRLDEWLAKVSWLGELVSVFWWVDLDIFSMEFNEVSSSAFWGIYGFDMVFFRQSFNAQGCVPVFLEN